MRGLGNKVAMVTGGGSGIGRAICLRLAEEHMPVAIVDMNGSAASATAELIAVAVKAPPREIRSLDQAAVQRAVAGAEAALGPIYALVNNAGWDTPYPFSRPTPDFWQK